MDRRTLEVYALRGDAYEHVATHPGADVAQLDVPAGFALALGEIWPEA